ncbi:MAG: rod shape-determining protein MreC [Bacteroidota bacterium]
MRNLIVFFRRFRVFLLFAGMQIFALYTFFSYLEFPRSQYFTTASTINGKILSVQNDVTKHFNLSNSNLKLQRENIELRMKMPQSFTRLENGLVKINDTLFKQQYEYIPATIINASYTRANNYFTLNIGSTQGIKRDMGVISDKGIVGVVHNVSKHFCVVKSMLTSNINVDVIIEKSGLSGLMKWDGRNPRYGQISGISNDMKIKKWSRVVTQGGSGIFPRGLLVGKVKELKSIEGKAVWDVNVLFSEDYRKLQNVYIVRNLFIEEQEKLEAQIPIDPVK